MWCGKFRDFSRDFFIFHIRLPDKALRVVCRSFCARIPRFLRRGERRVIAAVINAKSSMAHNNRLKAARVLKGLTQLQLAEKIGSKEIHISRVETGRVRPDAALKHRIAAVLEKPAFELFDC